LSQWPWKPIPRSIVSMLTRTVSRGRHRTIFRSTLYSVD
jgi:hypothetical protein